MSERQGGITLRKYAFAASRGVGLASGTPWRGPHEWLLVDKNEFVLETYRSGEQAVGELNVRFDNNPDLVQRLRLVLLEPTGVQHDEWPRGGSLAERAGALARQLSVNDALTDTELDDIVRAHFLRGEMGRTHLAGEQRAEHRAVVVRR
jgi:hypothetical protein